jgi:hypothetical protein
MPRILFVVFVLSFFVEEAHATMVVYYTDEELFDAADVVLVGTVWRRSIEESGFFPSTDYEVESEECFKGCKKGAWVVMRSPGVNFHDPETGDYRPIFGAPDAEPGSRVVLYLKRTRTKELVPISLGLSVYKLRYQGVLKQYIAQRQVEQLSAVLPARPGRDEGMREVEVVRDRFANELIDSLRQLASRRGTR